VVRIDPQDAHLPVERPVLADREVLAHPKRGALARLQSAPSAAYKARFDDLRGDVLAAQGKVAEARAAYQAAIDALAAVGDDAVTLREVVRVKLESLGA
ncbi:MAG TPA: tetratricopeptide repeat protein, partial [Thauera aminoaromatica]|nr:tetratricopeptide repeat protein [Thauera aminoaromatica]